jgi:hypothetical protein
MGPLRRAPERSSLKIRMTVSRLALSAFAVAAAFPATAQDDVAALLAKAVSAFESNQQNEKHWNWSTLETRHLANKSGDILQSFPYVISESIIRSNGRRCNALNTWGDGRAPYLKDADSDERCQAFNAIGTPLRVPLLLKGVRARLIDRSASAIHISVLPDGSRTKSPDFDVRCAASIKADIQLDPSTFFPMVIDGEVAESGCDGEFQPVIHYETVTRQPMASQFRKGASFHLVYALQKDKFGNPENSFWISTEQHYSLPWKSEARVLYYWGRQFPVTQEKGYRLIEDTKTTAREFGAGSEVRFDK